MSKFVVSVLALAALGLLWEKAFCYPYWNEEAEIERWCRKIRCPTRYCPDPIRIKGKCCPICPKPQPVSCSIEGQIFQECGTACPPTCDVPFPDFCTRQCVPGCQCPGGTVLDEKANKCVPRSECSISLPPIDCAVVRCAAPDCLNHITPPGRCCPVCPKPNCAAVLCAVPNCPNPITPKGQCCPVCLEQPTPEIDPDFCPIEGQIFQECGTACPPTCDVPFPDFCTKQCVPGCQCPGGTVLDEKANKCVPRSKCSKSLPPINCAAVSCILPNCPNPVIPPGQCCPVCPKLPTIESLNCAAVLCALPECLNPVTLKGQCCPVCLKPNCAAVSCILPNCPNSITPKGQCCPVCPKLLSCPIEGQIFQECGTACPPTCDVPFPDFCTRQCVPGCQCPRGTVLDEKANKCVPRSECSISLPPIDCAVVRCAAPDCLNHITPPGRCCPVCPKPNCAAVLCALPNCPNPITPKGQCCPVCPKPNCAAVSCILPSCPNPAIPPGQCCPVCPTCPPDCTHDFCSSNPKALCNVPGPREIPGCFGGRCQLTFCPACYYSKETRDLPGNCGDCGSPVKSLNCLRNWATCIHNADMWENGSPNPSIMSQEYFKCYRYPCKLRG